MLEFEKELAKYELKIRCNNTVYEAEKLIRVVSALPYRRKSELFRYGDELLAAERNLSGAINRLHSSINESIDDIGEETENEVSIDRSEAGLTFENGVYHFKLPPLRPVYGNIEPRRDYYHRSLVELLLAERRFREGYEMIDGRAAVAMVHDIEETVSQSRIPDYDNLRTKAVIDSLGMKLIRNDNMLSAVVMSFGRRREKAAFHIYVMKASDLSEWIISNV